MTYNVFGGTLNLAQSIMLSLIDNQASTVTKYFFRKLLGGTWWAFAVSQ